MLEALGTRGAGRFNFEFCQASACQNIVYCMLFFRLQPYKTAKKLNSEVETSSLTFLGGCLKRSAQGAPVTISSADSDAWKKLKDAVAAADDGDVFIIDGEIKASTGSNEVLHQDTNGTINNTSGNTAS